MQMIRPEDLIHKSQLNRLLIEIADHPHLSQALAFKGGTCAAMLGFLDRFSVDLDFDIPQALDEALIKEEFHHLFDILGFAVIRELEKAVFFQLRYPSQARQRSTLKVGASDLRVRANRYKIQYFAEIDRLINSQTLETIVANKFVAVMDRYRQHHTIAGRDIYDIHHFMINGYPYEPSVITERTGLESKVFFQTLIDFIQEHVTQTIVQEDLNALLPAREFQAIRKILIPETLALLSARLSDPTP